METGVQLYKRLTTIKRISIPSIQDGHLTSLSAEACLQTIV